MNLMSKIISYYNNEERESTYYKLIEFVLKNLRHIQDLSISDFAEETYVSKSTISRFVRYLGMDTYIEFKEYFREISNASRNSFLRITPEEYQNVSVNPDLFLEHYVNEITESLNDLRKTIDLQEIDKLIERIFNANNVAILGYSDSLAIAKDIQLGLITLKTIEVAENEKKYEEILNEYTEKDLIIILSNYGNFFNTNKDFEHQVSKSKVPIVLVTQNFNSMYVFHFEQTIYLTSKRHLSIGNYPIRVFSDYVVRRAISLNSKKQ